MNKDVEQLVKDARLQGWVITLTNGGHYKWVSPSGGMFYSPKTPSDPRSIKNIKRDMKVNGFIEIKKQGRKKR